MTLRYIAQEVPGLIPGSDMTLGKPSALVWEAGVISWVDSSHADSQHPL